MRFGKLVKKRSWVSFMRQFVRDLRSAARVSCLEDRSLILSNRKQWRVYVRGKGVRGGLGIKICGFFSVCQGRSTNLFAKVRKSDSRDGSGLTKEYQKHR